MSRDHEYPTESSEAFIYAALIRLPLRRLARAPVGTGRKRLLETPSRDGSPIPAHATRPEFAAPTCYWHPAVSPSGMIFYTGSLFADWRGNVLPGGLSSGALIRLTPDGNRVMAEERIKHAPPYS